MDDVDGTEDDRDNRGGRDGPEDRASAADGVEHLQRAAREMIAAARSFLDAVEHVVEDNEALRDLSATVGDVAATVVESVRSTRPAPWSDAAWARPDTPESEPSRRSTGTDPGRDAVVHADVVASADAMAARHEATVDATDVGNAEDDGERTEAWARRLVDADAPRRPSRVRRIAVD